jgi:hypothetical protein
MITNDSLVNQNECWEAQWKAAQKPLVVLKIM